MKVSIITPCYKYPHLVKQLVEGIAKTEGQDFELILVDNGNGVPKDLPKYPWLKVLTPEKNLGFGGGNNFGAKHATGDAVLFLNDDVVIDSPLWLQQLFVHLKLEPESIVGTHLVKDNEFTRVHGKLHRYINGWCMLMKCSFFEEIGGFDLSFGLGWFEDVWLCQQALKRGYKLIEAKVAITHLGSQTIMDGSFDTNKMMARAGYYFRDRIVKELIPKGKLRIVFLSQGNYQFSDGSWEGKGVGGAEAALIQLTRELAKQGHLVEVYNDPELMGLQNGVYYHRIKEFRYSDYCDVFINFRNPVAFVDQVNSPVKIFWSCDQRTIGDYDKNVFPLYDKIITISAYHKKYFEKTYKEYLDHKVETIGLGIHLSDYENIGLKEKIPYKLIFCSVPHRGLMELLNRYKKIKVQFPQTELVITSDYTLWGQKEPANKDFIDAARLLPGVKFLGNIPRAELVKHQREADVMAYPCIYDENFCIAAAECVAAGAVPVIMDCGATGETVGSAGVVTPASDTDRWEVEILRLLADRERLETLRKVGYKRAKSKFDWKMLAKRWETLLYSLKKESMLNLKIRLPDKPEKLTVLDLGCGEFTSGVSENIPLLPFKSYTGVELHEQTFLRAVKKELKAKDYKIISADVLQFVESQVAAGNKYDCVFMFDVLEHFKKEDGEKLLKFVDKLCTRRQLFFMPLGEHTLEANDGIVDKNPLQQHQSQWEKDEFIKLGYDVELWNGFHHSGKLDAGWIYKDTKYMVKCKTCDAEFASSYWLSKHANSHAKPTGKDTNEWDVPMANDMPTAMPPVKLVFSKKVEVSVNLLSLDRVTEAVIPYEQVSDICRILQEAYGDDIIVSQDFVAG